MKRIHFTAVMPVLILAAAIAACDKPAPAPVPEASPAPAASPFPGTYTGSWAAVADTTDHGTAQWQISETGVLTGTDHDAVANTSDHLTGTVDSAGHITITTAPEDGSAGTHLTGTLHVDGPARVSGVLLWDGKPPTQYNYTLTRAP